MARIIVLDTFPLSSMGRRLPPAGTPRTEGEKCHEWIRACIAAGHQVVAPAVCYYEVLRELERLDARAQIARLQAFCFASQARLLSINDRHLEAAARLWAQARQDGVPTASPEALDVDVILAAQAQALRARSDAYVIATTNVGHLARFVPAQHWAQIAPGS